MADMLDTLEAARNALKGMLLTTPDGALVPVLMRGDTDPAGEQIEVVILDRVADTALPTYGLGSTTKRIQVSCYASTTARALELTKQVRAALATIGQRYLQSRPTPDLVGEVSEYRS